MRSKSLKILLISREYPPETGYGGIGTYTSILASSLANRGHEVHILSCDPFQESIDILIQQNVHLHRRHRKVIWLKWLKILGMRHTLSRLEAAISVYREFKKVARDVDIIEYPDWEAEGWLLALLKPKPLIVTLHTPLPIIACYQDISKNLDYRLASALEKFSASRADIVTAPSKLIINKLKEFGWFKENCNIEIIPYPIDWLGWLDTKPISQTKQIILFVGRIERRKAPELLVKALEQLRNDFPEVRAVFIGRSSGKRDGIPYLDWLKKIASTAGNCEFVGHISRDKLFRYLSESRLVVLPSRFESGPFVALEAMAAGRPIVVSENTGIAEYVKRYGLGEVFPDGDVNGLAEAIRPYLENPHIAEEVGERARQFVVTFLDPNHIAELREQVYWRAINYRKERLRRNFKLYFAIPDQVGLWKIPKKWKEWAIDECIQTPWKHFYLPTARHLLELLSMHPILKDKASLEGMHILDFGCTPAISVLLACLGAHVTLLDIELKELEKGRLYAQELGIEGRIHCIQADAFNAPFKPQTFDIVWNSGFVEHFDNPTTIIRLMATLTKPKGAVVVLVPNLWTPQSLAIREYLRRTKSKGYYWDYMGRERSYSIDQLVKLFKKAGLRPIGASTANLRRSILDDDIILRHLRGIPMRKLLWHLINFCDWLEYKFPWLRKFGFMAGCIGIVDPNFSHE